MTTKANNKVTTTKQVTNKAIKTATTPRKTKANSIIIKGIRS